MPRNVVVIGAGNTAIDAAIQSKRLGAENVTLVYRRGEESMSATRFEIDLARQNGVNFCFWAAPAIFVITEPLASIKFQRTEYDNNRLITTDESFTIQTDMLLKAIGQKLNLDTDPTLLPEILNGKFVVDNYATSITGVFAGGDCIASGEDLTVQSVEDGKQAAHAIDSYLASQSSGEIS